MRQTPRQFEHRSSLGRSISLGRYDPLTHLTSLIFHRLMNGIFSKFLSHLRFDRSFGHHWTHYPRLVDDKLRAEISAKPLKGQLGLGSHRPEWPWISSHDSHTGTAQQSRADSQVLGCQLCPWRNILVSKVKMVKICSLFLEWILGQSWVKSL